MRGSVEETLNELLEAEAEKLTQAARYERNEQRQGYLSAGTQKELLEKLHRCMEEYDGAELTEDCRMTLGE